MPQVAPFTISTDGPPAIDPPELSRGATVGRYVILRRIGGGGMGVVYLAADEELERRVAIKVIRAGSMPGGTDIEKRARLLREAQAMAKVSHPSVVAVYDVGTYGEEVFLAMEYVKGETLRAWRAGARPSVRSILDVYAQAGRGLEAAHAAGILHRDFKPDNVMVAAQGGVRVLDFGLARAYGAIATSAAAEATNVDLHAMETQPPMTGAAAPLTHVGAIVGTPMYMAPEQLVGEPTTAKSDQFSFCVSLYEALYGELPFEGHTVAELHGNILASRLRSLRSGPGQARVPAHVRRALLRGLSGSPDRRYASVGELLAALDADPGRRVRRWGALGAVVVACGAAIVAQRTAQHRMVLECQTMARPWSGIWDAPRKRALASAFAATQLSYATETWARVEQAFDEYTTAWTTSMEAACVATRVHHEQSAERFERKTSCLVDGFEDVRALSDVFASADVETVKRAMDAVWVLGRAPSCSDDQVSARALLPVEPAARAEIRRVQKILAEINAQQSAGHARLARSKLEEVRGRVDATGFGPLRETWIEQLAAADDTLDPKQAVADYEEAYARADGSHLDEKKVRSALWIASLDAEWLDRPDEARRWRRLAASAIERMGGNARLEIWLDIEEGIAEQKAHVPTDRFERVLSRLDALKIDEVKFRFAAYNGVAQELVNEGRAGEAIANVRLAVADTERVYGPNNPRLVLAYGNLANVMILAGRCMDALAPAERALAVFDQISSPQPGGPPASSSHLAWAEDQLGYALVRLNRAAEGIAHLSRAHEILVKSMGNDNTYALKVGVELAEASLLAGDAKEGAYSARPGRPFRCDVGSRSDPPGRSIGAQRRVDGQVDVQLASEPIPFFLRIDGPRNATT